MRVLSVNVGLPQPLVAHDQVVQSGIVKRPVNGPVTIRRTNLDGDGQGDPSVHGGPLKAVYAYASEHYAFWCNEYPDAALPFGTFGENLTTAGLLDEEVCIGDRFQVGAAVLMVTQPRMPCFKLAARFQRHEILERMIDARRHGFYFAVLEEGPVCAGDPIRLLERHPAALSVPTMVALYLGHSVDPHLLERAMSLEMLTPKWKNKLALRAAV